MSKIRGLTEEECRRIKVNQYDTGFSLWMDQPGHRGERVILDASMLHKNGIIKLHPPFEHPNGGFKFGSIIIDDEIKIVAIE